MTAGHPSRARRPRLIVKILGVSFAVIALVLTAAFLVLSWQVRSLLTDGIVSSLERSQQRFGEIEARRKRDRLAQATVVIEQPTLKASIDTYQSERRTSGAVEQLEATVLGEMGKLQRALGVPALVATDSEGRIIAAVGPLAADWSPGRTVPPRQWPSPAPVEAVVESGRRVYLATVAPVVLGGDVVGEFLLASPLDAGYARDLAGDAGTDVMVLLGGRVVTGTAAAAVGDAIAAAGRPTAGTIAVGGDQFVVRQLAAVDDAAVYAVGSVGAAARAAVAGTATLLALVGLGSLLLAALASAWLARTLSRPIDVLTATLARMARERRFEEVLAPIGASRELDDLAETFDALRQSVVAAEAEAEASYLGVIGTLAKALDARDRYTAGHSERVACLSVAVGQALGLSGPDLEMLRLGALLHDIGKIGVPDAVLRKPGLLTDEEFAQIELHPLIGARILEPLCLPAEVLAVVELHHEQPDGQGYPHGLDDDRIPLLAAIVHAVDAFDAMTSARAYRPARPFADAVAELQRHAGTGFNVEVVGALAALPLPALEAAVGGAVEPGTGDDRGSAMVLPFRTLAASAARRSVAG